MAKIINYSNLQSYIIQTCRSNSSSKGEKQNSRRKLHFYSMYSDIKKEVAVRDTNNKNEKVASITHKQVCPHACFLQPLRMRKNTNPFIKFI